MAYEDGTLILRWGESDQIRYTRVNGNQLIMCARMNNWDRFTALWQKKTEANVWEAIQVYFADLDRPSKWRLKESFARLSTTPDDVSGDPQKVINKVDLTSS